MRLNGFYDTYEKRDSRTIYSVTLDDGRRVNVIRKHFPEFDESKSLWSVEEDIDNERNIISFVKKNVPKTHTMMPRFERRSKNAYATVSDTCYSLEQAIWLADNAWKQSNADSWEIFQIRCDEEIIENYLEEKLCRIS